MLDTVPPTKIVNAGTVGWLKQAIHRSRNEVFSEIKTVTPGLAEVILTQNPDNRRIKPVKLAQMVSDMNGGRWAVNGEPIIVAKTGELNDGQHRLLAVIESKTPVSMLFVFGVERETRTTVDQGANRSAGDYLHMSGAQNAATLAAITRHIISMERQQFKVVGRVSEITAAEVLARISRDITLAVSAKYGDANKNRMRKFCTGTVLGICHNVLLSENVTEGVAFMSTLCSGEDLKIGDAIYTARERLLGLDKGKTTAVCVEIIFRAWNGYRERRPMKTIPIHNRLPELV